LLAITPKLLIARSWKLDDNPECGYWPHTDKITLKESVISGLYTEKVALNHGWHRPPRFQLPSPAEVLNLPPVLPHR
jgi:hypothetical protein